MLFNPDEEEVLRVYTYAGDFDICRVELHEKFEDGNHFGRYLWDIAQRMAGQEDGWPLDEICQGFVHAIHIYQVARDAVREGNTLSLEAVNELIALPEIVQLPSGVKIKTT